MTVEYQGDALSYGMSRRNPEDIQYIVIHHSATLNGNVAIFRDYHINHNGWADIGYHYVICNGNGGPDGEVQEGRNILFAGAHAPGRNNDSVGICLVGDFIKGRPTNAQMIALYPLLRELIRKYPITPERILAHKEVNQTDCPGSLDVNAIRTVLEQPPEPTVVVNGLTLPAIMVGVKVYAPVRDLIDALNYKVEWDGAKRTVNILSGGSNHA